jgi:nicotinamidase-related amidase
MNKALLLIDIQNDYFPGGKSELKNPIEASLNAKKVLNFFREKRMPVFHIQHLSKQNMLVEGTSGAEIHENVKPLYNEKIIRKRYPNSFRDTDLLNELKENNIDELVISGMMTHMCVEATTRAAFDYCFKITVLEDACATKDLTFKGKIIPAEIVHKSFLAALNNTYATLLDTETFLKNQVPLKAE